MTTENLIPRPEETVTEQGDEKPNQTTSVESDQSVEPEKTPNLMSGADTSNKGTDWEKRYKDLQSFQSKRENELRDKIKELEAADSTFQAPTTPDQMEAFKEEHPEMYNLMLTLAHQKASEATQGISDKLQTYEEERMMNEFEQAQARIKEVHPDFIDVVQSADFQGWAQAQPQQVQQWIYNNPDDPDLAIIALDRYKASRDASTAHPEKEAPKQDAAVEDTASAAQAVSSGSSAPQTAEGKKIWTASEIKGLSRKEWQKHAEEIDAAYDEGRVNFKA